MAIYNLTQMKENHDARWEKALAQIRDNVTEQIYKTWFQPIVFEQFDAAQRRILVQVPSPFVYEYLEENFLSLLGKVLCNCFGPGIQLSYRVVTDKEHNLSQDIQADPTDADVKPQPRTGVNQSPTVLDAAQPQQIDSQLNPHLTCGKTHLINAIGMRTKQLYPQKRVLYVSARLFQVQYSNAVLKNAINDFIGFYQTIDMIIVDDIQEWMGKTSTLNTFFYIFNHLFKNGKRIILASDRPPVDLKDVPDRLLSRFSCGLIAEMSKPNLKLRVDILENQVRRDGLKIPHDVVEFIAETAKGSVRDLQGVITSLMAYSIVYNCNIDMRLANRVIKRAVKSDDKPLTVDDILEKVCGHFNVTTEQINSKSRKREFVLARQVSMYLASKYTKMPASRIGKLVGNRDHSTVLHSCSQVEHRLHTDKAFSDEIVGIENEFKLKK